MFIAATGHRPRKLGGYDEAIYHLLVLLAVEYLKDQKPDKTISGMALGWDQAFTEASISLGIPFIAAVPFKGQEKMWPGESQKFYYSLLKKANEIVYVSDGEYSPKLMQVRNEWMVDHSDKICALWDGTYGGTANCVRYATKVGKPIDNLWQQWKNG